ncbi:hypothetical protein CC1G_07991 [Coprinopsis cinerea okayama7|uniref:DH domain-containing protein n=1 Tax=Coprinopsis cinerea (strain Okayama-7 / 130 / ATCC MYA-4618 / FGSC 9003) TaxID=240176 RepID=A8P256_COPC7|nr:hypothetical protein CC1G_07991 [Coprinopsis cinerea okayama7\|eukprot:XP_001838250.1 hypothetical protein CC1G_07991 [Coprinopsis cinerea okayama7\
MASVPEPTPAESETNLVEPKASVTEGNRAAFDANLHFPALVKETRAKPERQQALSSPSRTPRANEKTSKPMVPVRSPKPKDDHTWFNESSHELENGFQAPTPRVISRKSPPSLHPKPRVTLAQETTFHAFHQRQAFGIPPSNSDEIYNGQSSKRWSEGSSQRSSVSSNTWQWDDDAPLDSRNEESSLSVGAESMLRSLSNDSKDRETETFKQSSAHQEVPRFSVVSATSTGSSMYDDHHLTDSSDSEFEDARQDYCFGDGSLQSPGERRQHHHRQNEHQHSVRLVSKRPEPANANRREVILQEFMESEETFLDNAQYCIDNFILPIRTQDRRSWIGGVPADISRLLDWYEDIVNLHMCILQTLESSMSTQGPGSSTINGLPGYLKDFVPRLHVYQPYLVRLADVLEEVAKLASNTDSDFGEFIRMQERILKPKGWTFEGLLMEPVHRLAAYQDMFTDLLDHTPQSHPEFLASYTLAKSVDTVMKVLTEVKLRENEYKLIQTLASQISDSAVGDSLATRERRLLYSGTVRLISHALPPPVTPSGLSSPQLSRVGKPTNRLVEAISVWERSPKRSDSVKSTSSSITASMKSFNTASSGSASINLDGASRLPKLKDMFKRKPSRTGLSNSSVDSSSAHPTTIIPPDHVQAFVFSDLLLLITPRQSSASQYDLVPGVGLSRIFSVSQTSVDNPQGQWPSHAPNAAKPTTTNSRTEFTLQLIPTPRAVNTNGAASIPASTPLTSAVVEIVLKSDSQEGSGERTPASAELVESFSKALEQSTRHTQRLLSFSGFQDAANFRSDSSKDTWLTVSSLMASGLPMPKSPSGELPDLKYGQEDEEAKKMEREERGWWTLRYQQVLGEMHRQCVFTASTTTTTTTGR